MTEKLLMKLLGAGLTPEQIAEREGVTAHTVRFWIRDLKKSLSKRGKDEKNKGV